ncbi:hypothetical protein HanXRQr2_Chr17g0805131 [Helianthus annuus]|uniref:Uncharacterized protein n=1 Tax=Helianthus annuus TaxID=4232 RepID=A0A9K3DK42_HELAN|nr:hypothetical protein HanXRQr2_Chr17g0805131 [Helianthus annuus]
MGQNGFGLKRVRVKTGQLKKRVVLVRVKTGSGRNGFGLKRVWVGTGSGKNGFRVGSGRLKKCFFFFFFFFFFCNTTIMFCIYISAKYQMLQYQVLHLLHMFLYRYRHMCKFVSVI